MKIWAIVISIFLLPSVVQAEIIISEISWMGILSDANKESIEFYNTSNSDIDLSGWILFRKDKNTFVDKDIFSLQGVLSRGDYLVVERILSSEKDSISLGKIKTKFKGGALANTGEYLILKNSSGDIIWELDNLSGWQAGDNTTKHTMQYNGGLWLTAPETLGFQNATIDTSPKDQNNKKDSTQKSNTVKSQELFLEISAEKDIYQNIPTIFSAEGIVPKNHKGKFIWNMGDGTYIEKKNLESIQHVYKNLGTYNVTLALVDKKDVLILRDDISITIKVFDLEIEKIDNYNLILKNKTNTKIDLSKVKIINQNTYLSIPRFTELSSKAEIVLTLKDEIGDKLDIYSDNGTLLFTKNFRVENSIEIKNISQNAPSILSTKSISNNQTFSAEDKKAEVFSDSIVLNSEPIKQKSHTSKIFIGMTIFVVIGLFLLLERFMTQKE